MKVEVCADLPTYAVERVGKESGDSVMRDGVMENDVGNESGGTGEKVEASWVFGGVSLGNGMPPVCKHLLACVLVKRCKGLFGACVEERDVGIEEAAGWAAGWGD